MNYFEGFQFQQIPNASAIEQFQLVLLEGVLRSDYQTGDPIIIGALPRDPGNEETFIPWTPNSIRRVFAEKLKSLSEEIGEPLSLKERRIRFVTKGALKPKTAEERNYLVDNYGEGILDQQFGYCIRNLDGTFLITIGRAREGNVVPLDEVLSEMAHEHGHTLGERISEPSLEELKASAFDNLFMRYYYQNPKYRVNPLDQSNPHLKAYDYLNQLLEMGVSEEAVLAHLIGQPFGGANPDDYSKVLVNDPELV